jgi:hypothetical protein
VCVCLLLIFEIYFFAAPPDGHGDIYRQLPSELLFPAAGGHSQKPVPFLNLLSQISPAQFTLREKGGGGGGDS